MKTDNNLKQRKAENTDKTTEQLRKEVAHLKKEICRLQTPNFSKEKYRAVFEQASDSLFLLDIKSGNFLEFNDNAHKNMGYTRQEFKHLHITDLEAALSPSEINKHNNKVFKGINPVFETKHRKKDGQIRDVLMRLKPIVIKGNKYILATGTDITEKMHAEKLLREKNLELENTVAAMKILLKQIEIDRNIVKKNLFSNFGEMVGPYVRKLDNACNDPEQNKCLENIKSNLNKLNETLPNVTSLKDLKLTTAELQIANFIKHNRTSKEISEMMNVAVSTIAFHRKNIRNKLNLKNSKINLKSYLSGLQD